ncbi:MAG: HDOD domain-containing protein [Desulfobulbaceae bacterium]|nr:MAG: HDOD domain-containing protein [Desulfobulbaceae bacterium]
MEIFVARQPILNEHKKLFAYELLYRGTDDGRLASGEKMTASLLSATFLTEGLDVISGSKPCFINFTEELLLKGIPSSFPGTKIVVEILETVSPTADILKACQILREEGYTIALDDFVYDKKLEPLIVLADIIKIDFRLSPVDEIRRTLFKLAHFPVKFLAEKVETYEEFDLASKLGFKYFQGHFFCKPEVFRIRELESVKASLIALLAEVTKKSTSTERLEQIIGKDVALSYKLLRYINSSYFYRINSIDSVRHAIVFLGEIEIKRFVLLVIISEIATDKPGVLVKLAFIRARFCELLAENSRYQKMSAEIFLLGLLSLLDAMLDIQMRTVLAQLPLADVLKHALADRTGPMAPFLNAVTAYEQHDRSACITALDEIGVDKKLVQQMYFDSLAFADALSNF